MVKITGFEKDINEFSEWLTASARISKKAAKDCISRCRRVQKELKIDLADAVSNEVAYQLLIKEVKGITFTYADLRAACRKYADFKVPAKSKHYKKFIR